MTETAVIAHGLAHCEKPERYIQQLVSHSQELESTVAELREKLARLEKDANLTANLSSAILSATGHYAPRLFAALTAAGTVYLLTYDIRPVPFINVLLYGLPVYLAALLSIHLIFTPKPPNRKMLSVSDELARKMARRLRVLALLAYVGYLVFSTILAQHLPDEAYLLARGIYAGLLFLNMIWISPNGCIGVIGEVFVNGSLDRIKAYPLRTYV